MVITEDHLETRSTQELLARARAGNAAAFCQLIEDCQTRLFRQAVALSGDVSAAEDLVEETLVEAWRCLRNYDGTCRLTTWLYAILLHRFQKSRRRARSRPVSLASLPQAEAVEREAESERLPARDASPADIAARNEEARQLRACVEALPEKHRQVVRLRFFEDASLPDIAVVLGCSLGTVKSRLHHALERLRQMKMNLSSLRRDT